MKTLRSLRIASSAVFFALLFSAAAAAQSTGPQQGQSLFDGSCARCHGFDAAGAIGPNLQRSTLVRAENEAAFRAIVQNGIPVRGMPATPGLTDQELNTLAAYVRSLRGIDPGVQSARAVRGKEVYKQLDCGSCHIVQGEGRGIGPELTGIGVKRKVEQLRQDLLEPAASLPQGAGGVTEFLSVRVVTLQGQETSGIRINEDAFSIQLRDGDDRLRTFKKSDLRQIDKQYDRSAMPRYALDGAKMDDLVAYLSSLRGVK